MALLAWFAAPQAAHANPTVTQGSSATFARSGTSSPASFPWDIVLSGSAVASASATNGWSVSYNSSAQQFTVGAPISATVATGYEVRYYAAMGGASAIFDVVAATLQVSSLTISPTSIIGGGAVSGTVTLNLAAPTGGAAVALSCSTALAALFPATVTVAAGQTSATFTINTSTANFPITVTFTAAFGGQNATAALTLLPTNLHVTDILPPYRVKLAWGCQATGSFVLKRDGATVATLANSVYTYIDVFAPSFNNGQIYYYEIFDSADMGMPPTHLSASKVVPYQVAATDNQTVDSRLDLRYAANVFLDHLFGTGVYRGGLFAGTASDNSKVGRSYAKFSLEAPAAGLDFRVGNIDAYCTGAATSGSQTVNVNIGCQSVSAGAWLSSSLVWSTAFNLNLNPAAIEGTATVHYDPTVTPDPAPGWVAWPMHASLKSALANTAVPYTVGWAGANEANTGWAYFAKKEYDALLGPLACYAMEAPIPIQISFNPTFITGGGDVTCTLTINGVGIGDSVNVSLDFAYPQGTVISNVSGGSPVTGLSRSFTFRVGTPPGGCLLLSAGPPPVYAAYPGPGGWVIVTATCNGVSGTATLMIAGYPAPANCP